MRFVVVVYVVLQLLACWHIDRAWATDVASLPPLGTPAQVTDGIVTYDSSQPQGSRFSELNFPGGINQYLRGDGGWSELGGITNIVWLGTSIPERGIDTNTSYPEKVGEYLGVTVDNQAVGASAMRWNIDESDESCSSRSWVARGLSATLAEIQDKIDNATEGSAYCTSSSAGCTTTCDTNGGNLGDAYLLSLSYESKIIGSGADLVVFDHGHNDRLYPLGTLDETWNPVTNLSVSGTVLTLDTTYDHNLVVGDDVSIRDMDEDTGVNNFTAEVVSIVDADTFTMIVPTGTYTNCTSCVNVGFAVYDKASYYDAANFVIRATIFDNPDVRIVFANPPNFYPKGEDATYIDKIRTANFNLAKKYGSAVFDMTTSLGINEANVTTFLPDGTHPDIESTRTMIAESLSGWLSGGFTNTNPIVEDSSPPHYMAFANPNYTGDFNRANTTNIGSNWLEYSQDAKIVNNELRIDYVDNGNAFLINQNDTVTANQYGRLKVLVNNTGFVFRANADGGGYKYRVQLVPGSNNVVWSLFNGLGNSGTLESIALTHNYTDNIGCTVTGPGSDTTVSLWVNPQHEVPFSDGPLCVDKTRPCWDDATDGPDAQSTVDAGTYATGTYMGIASYSTTTNTMDDFHGGGFDDIRLNYIDVTDLGATGDGVTNDTVAIQTALTAAASGGTVVFPKGEYLVTPGALSLTSATGMRIVGYGASINGTGTGSGFDSLLRFTTSSNITIEGLHFNANVDDEAITTLSGITFDGATNITVQNNTFELCYYGIYSRALSGAVDGVQIIGNSMTGLDFNAAARANNQLPVGLFHVTDGASNVRVSGNHTNLVNMCFLGDTTNGTVSNNISLNSEDTTIYVTRGPATVSNNIIINAGKDGIKCRTAAAESLVVDGNFIAGTGFNKSDGGAYIQSYGDNSTISDNMLVFNDVTAVAATSLVGIGIAGDNVSVSDNTVAGYSRADGASWGITARTSIALKALTNATVKGNHIKNVYSGIELNNSAGYTNYRNRISGNTVELTDIYGIRMYSTPTVAEYYDVSVTDNLIIDNLQNPINVYRVGKPLVANNTIKDSTVNYLVNLRYSTDAMYFGNKSNLAANTSFVYAPDTVSTIYDDGI